MVLARQCRCALSSTAASPFDLAIFGWFWPFWSILHENLQKQNGARRPLLARKGKNRSFISRGVLMRQLYRSSLAIKGSLLLTCTRKRWGTQGSKNQRKRETRKGPLEWFCVTTAATRPSSAHIFWLTFCPFGYNIKVGRFRIEFQMKREKKIPLRCQRWLRCGSNDRWSSYLATGLLLAAPLILLWCPLDG